MKTKQIKKTILTGLLCMLCTYLGSAQDNTTDIIGTWMFQEGPSFEKMAPDIQAHLDSLPVIRDQILGKYSGRSLLFQVDGFFQQTIADGSTLTGSWAIGPGGVLTITAANGAVWQQNFYLEPQRLVLIQGSAGQARPMLGELHFSKIQ